jgi:hypothetical protein
MLLNFSQSYQINGLGGSSQVHRAECQRFARNEVAQVSAPTQKQFVEERPLIVALAGEPQKVATIELKEAYPH